MGNDESKQDKDSTKLKKEITNKESVLDSSKSKTKKIKEPKPKPIRLTDFSINLGMKFSMNNVHFEIDSHSRTRSDNFVKCIQQTDKLNKEYPKRIFLDKEQLRHVSSKHMDKLRNDQVTTNQIRQTLRKQKAEKASDKIKKYLDGYVDNSMSIAQIHQKMHADKVDANTIIPFIDDNDAIKLKKSI